MNSILLLVLLLCFINTVKPDNCQSVYNCTLPGNNCYNFGTCSSSGTCACNLNYGFSGGNCTLEYCGGLADGYNNRTFRPYHSLCCEQGYTGYSCNVCTTNSSCSALVSQDNSSTVYSTYCNQLGVALGSQHWSQCFLSNSVWNTVFPMPTIISVMRNATAGTMFTAVYYVGNLQYSCHMTGCNQYYTNNRANVSYECSGLSCQCITNSTICSVPTFRSLISSASGLSSLSCDATNANATCALQLNFLSGLIPGGFTLNSCSTGECVVSASNVIGNSPIAEKATIRSSLTSGEVAGISIVSTLAAAAIGAFVVAHWQMTKMKQQAPTSPKHRTLFFKINSYYLKLNRFNMFYIFSKKEQETRLLLRNIEGSVKPGEMLTILGPSGAGKTTLLHLLARKVSAKDGLLDGSITLDNVKLSPSSFGRLCGFVRQDDILMPFLTVRETVEFAAQISLPEGTPRSSQAQLVDAVLTDLKLVKVQHSRIGNEQIRGISGGERRRTSIAVELVKNPTLLLLDEPTSGLDAASALLTMQILRDLARKHNTVIVCSLHQPRSDIFALFDKLLVLGPKTKYFYGSCNSVPQFLASKGISCPENYNIADYLIDLASREETSDTTDPAAQFSNGSSEFNEMSDVHDTNISNKSLDGGVPASIGTNDSNHNSDIKNPKTIINENEAEETDATQVERQSVASIRRTNSLQDLSSGKWSYNTSYLTQFKLLLKREWTSSWRDFHRVVAHLMLGIVLGLLIGGIYFGAPYTLAGAQNRVGGMFYILCILAFSSMSALGAFNGVRHIYMRERSDQLYSYVPLYLAKLLVDIIPLRIVPCILLGTSFYFMVGLYLAAAEFFKFLAVLVLFNVLMALFFLTLASHVLDLSLANLLGSMVALFMMLFAGLLINQNQISRPTFWLQYLSFFKYAYEAIAVNELLTLTVYQPYGNTQLPVAGPMLAQQFFGFDINSFITNVIVLSSLVVLFLIIFCGSIKLRI